MPESTDAQVPVEAAYAAAEERAVRTTRALILSEAQVLTLQERVRRLEADCVAYAADVRRLEERLQSAEQEESEARAFDACQGCPRRATKGVNHERTQDETGGPAAGGEADFPHPFSD